jgi:hypothetical protein
LEKGEEHREAAANVVHQVKRQSLQTEPNAAALFQKAVEVTVQPHDLRATKESSGK